VAVLALATLGTVGCASERTLIVPEPPTSYQELGPAEGSATGGLYVGATAYYFIPIALNSRVERAYQRALESVSGATGLIDVSIQETWLWIVLGTLRTTTITGQAIKEQ
jgi:hypothetical protein